MTAAVKEGDVQPLTHPDHIDAARRRGTATKLGALLGDDELVKAWCRRCGKEIQVPKFIREIAGGWNRKQKAIDAQYGPGVTSAYITMRDVATCDGLCTVLERERLTEIAMESAIERDELLAKLRAGNASLDERRLLQHRFGCWNEVRQQEINERERERHAANQQEPAPF